MNIKKGQIGNALESVAPNHVVAEASAIYDQDKEKYQGQINAEVDAQIFDPNDENPNTLIKRVQDVESLGTISLGPVEAQIATGTDFDNPTAEQRAKVPTVGAILDGLNDGIYDVSKRNPTGGENSDGKFTLAYILANADTLIPTSRRHGGMEICFVHSSDNKYLQYRYIGTAVTGSPSPFLDTANWQGVADIVNMAEENKYFLVAQNYWWNPSTGAKVINSNYLGTQGIKIQGGCRLNFSCSDTIYHLNFYSGIPGSDTFISTTDINANTASYISPVNAEFVTFTIKNAEGVDGVLIMTDSKNILKDLDDSTLLAHSELNSVIDCVDINVQFTKGSYLGANGVLQPAEDGYYSEKIPTKKGMKYVYTGKSQYNNPCIYVIYDRNLHVLAYESTAGDYEDYEIEVSNDNAYYIQFGSYITPPTCVVDNSGLEGRVSTLESSTTLLNNSVTALENYIEISVNLYDKNSALNVPDKFLGPSSYTSVEGFTSSCPIPVESGKTYKYKHDGNMGNNRNVWYVDAEGDRITTIAASDDGNGYDTFTADRNGYVRVNLGMQSPNIFMFCESSVYPSYYVPYQKVLTNDFVLNDTQKEEVEKIAVGNPLLGKFIAFDGDSICAGAGYNGGYGKIIAEENKMTYENKGVGGGTITYGTQTAGGVDRHWICTSVETLNVNADYIIVEGGVNDSNDTMGTENDSFDESDFDKTTYIGALDYMFCKLYERFPGKKIGFIIVHAVYAWVADRDGVSEYQSRKYVATVNACKKWGIPYIDLNVEAPPFGLLPDGNYIKDHYTKPSTEVGREQYGDGWHPNEEGYRKYYVPKITAWLRTL